jgi:hypothetical protein
MNKINIPLINKYSNAFNIKISLVFLLVDIRFETAFYSAAV